MVSIKENKVREILLVSAALVIFVLIIGWPQVNSFFKNLFGPEFPKFYVLTGEVMKVESDKIFFDAAVPVEQNGRRIIGFEERVALISENTDIFKQVNSDGGIDYEDAQFSDIVPGINILVYYLSQPSASSESLADKVEILAE